MRFDSLCFVDKVFQQVIEFRWAQESVVAGRHRRGGLRFLMEDVRFIQEMKGAVEGLQLQGEVIFVAREASQNAAIPKGHDNGPGTGVRVAIAVENCVSNFGGRLACSVVRKIGAEKTTGTVHHVALRTSGLSKEERLASFRITGEHGGRADALQGSHVSEDSLKFFRAQRGEAGHACGGTALLQDFEKLGIGSPPNFLAPTDVRGAFSAAAVQTVASRADGFECLLSLNRRCFGVLPGSRGATAVRDLRLRARYRGKKKKGARGEEEKTQAAHAIVSAAHGATRVARHSRIAIGKHRHSPERRIRQS